MKLTADTITDEQICELEVEATRLDDVEIIRECHRARRGRGGAANPYARARCAETINARSAT